MLVFYEEKTKELNDALDAAYKPAKNGLAIIDDSKSLQQAQLMSAEIEMASSCLVKAFLEESI